MKVMPSRANTLTSLALIALGSAGAACGSGSPAQSAESVGGSEALSFSGNQAGGSTGKPDGGSVAGSNGGDNQAGSAGNTTQGGSGSANPGSGGSASQGGRGGAGGGTNGAGGGGASGGSNNNTSGTGGRGNGTSGSSTGSAGSWGGGTAVYTTNFDLTEGAIAEGNVWSTGLDPLATPVSTANGIAFGTQTGQEIASKVYNDSHAWLSGTFPPNQRASAVIHRTGDSGGYLEVELLLRWSIGPLRKGTFGDTHSYGYEINLAHDGQYCKIARWFEPAICDSGAVISSLGVKDGDIFSAEIVGNTITASLTRNGQSTVLCTVTDNNPYTTGSPGMGYYRGTQPGATTNPTSFAFTSFTATSL
jgi:hypothetical protein